MHSHILKHRIEWVDIHFKCSGPNKPELTTLSREMTMKQDTSVHLAKDKNTFIDYIDVG